MRLYRITRGEYAHDLSGIGAELHGGRWNSPGKRVVYTASTAAMALLETLAWTSMEQLLKSGFVMIIVQCPDQSIEDVSLSDLTEGWNFLTSYPITQKIGDQWLSEKRTLLLRVPSAILPLEQNILINPAHPLMSRVSVEEMFDLILDPRLLKNVQ